MKTLSFETLIENNIINIEVMKEEKTIEAMNIDDLPTKVRANIGGTEVEIIPAFTDYSMEQPKKKESLLKNTDADKRMDVIFHFATPEVFWNEGITLFDRNGKSISKDTPNVLVTCDMADTYWRLFLDETLTNVQVHEFESVQEFAQTIGNSMLLSRSLNNVEKIGYAALATGNEAYKAVFEFAKKNGVPMNTAQLYHDMQMRPATTQLMMLGKEPKMIPTLGRTTEEAQEWYEQSRKTFIGSENKRYVPKVLNALLKKYSKEELMEVLQTIPANEMANAELQRCEEKEYCIMEALTSWMIDLRRNKSEKKAA